MLYWNSKAINSFLSSASCCIFCPSICAFICSNWALPCANACSFWTSACAAAWADSELDWVWAFIFSIWILLSLSSFFFLRNFNNWFANFTFLTSLKSIASSNSILCCCKAICILFSNICFSSSSGINSINIPKSYKCNSDISCNVATLWTPIACIKASFVGECSIISDILRDRHSATSAVRYSPACNICLVAVLELAAANFCTPTKAFLSGILPSLASFSPVASLIICR